MKQILSIIVVNLQQWNIIQYVLFNCGCKWIASGKNIINPTSNFPINIIVDNKNMMYGPIDFTYADHLNFDTAVEILKNEILKTNKNFIKDLNTQIRKEKLKSLENYELERTSNPS